MAAGAPTSTARRTAKRALVLCVTCLVAFAIVEVTLRIWRPLPLNAPLYPGECEVTTTPSPHSVIDPALDCRFAPGAVVDDPSSLFFAHDPHINPDGHRFVAEALLRAFDEPGGVLGSRKR